MDPSSPNKQVVKASRCALVAVAPGAAREPCGDRAGPVWDPVPVDTPTLPDDAFDFPHVFGVTGPEATLHLQGDVRAIHPYASVSKPLSALGALVAVERGLVDLEDPAGPEGATVRHLLAHTAGYPFEGEEALARPGARRIYSNTGFEHLAAHVEDATGYDHADWMEQAVVQPLELTDVDVTGSPAAGYRGSIRDLLALGRELLRPTLLSEDLWREATTVQFPGLSGILPGYGRQKHNDWGLGFEIRADKHPHWTGERSSPETFGHFGQSGSFLWVDPTRQLAAAFLGAEPFGPVHVQNWPALTDAILDRFPDEAP